jgi:hypothetical protein
MKFHTKNEIYNRKTRLKKFHIVPGFRLGRSELSVLKKWGEKENRPRN